MVNVDIDVSKLWIKKFDSVFQDIFSHKFTNFIFPGGRGSTKSSFVGGIIVPLLVIQNPNCHAVCFRKVGNTLKTSVYAQVQWGINELGLNDYFIQTFLYLYNGILLIYIPQIILLFSIYNYSNSSNFTYSKTFKLIILTLI